MSTRQIHELPPVDTLHIDDRLVISTAASNVTRQATFALLPYRRHGSGTIERRLAERLDELGASVRDYGGMGNGVANDAPAFTAALAANPVVVIPAGTWRLESTVPVPPGRTIIGAGRDATRIVATSPAASFHFHRNRGIYRIDTTSPDHWCRSAISGMTIQMHTNGIVVEGHEFRARDLVFVGGQPSGWCMDLIDANECWISGINAGFNFAHGAMQANGIRFRAITSGVNYGDSLIEEVCIALGGSNTIGILLDGASADVTKLINNVTLLRCMVHAPLSGTTPVPGTVAYKLVNAARILLLLCNAEVVETGFQEFSTRSGTSGRCNANTYILCHTHNIDPDRRYVDSNDDYPGSCANRTFLGCNFMGPKRTGTSSGDGGVLGDAGLVVREINGTDKFEKLAWQIRARDVGLPMLTAHYKGSGQPNWDTHPTNDTPYHGILFDLTSHQVATITRTIANGAPSPDDSSQQLTDVRLKLGNGEGDPRGQLARIEIADPLSLTPRTTEPPVDRPGLAIYATAATALPATDEQWLGPGWYLRLEDSDGVRRWVPMGVRRGAMPSRTRNFSWTVSASDFGKLIRVNHSDDRTITIPANLVGSNEGVRWFDVIREGTGHVFFAAGSGAALRLPRGRNSIRHQYQRVRVYVTSDNQIFIPDLYPDGEENHNQPLHWTAGGFAIPQSYLGRLVRVSNGNTTYLEIPTGIVPPGMPSAWFKVMKVGTGDVEIRAGAGMTLLAPGEVNPYILTQRYKVVTVYITSGDDSQQPNRIYIED